MSKISKKEVIKMIGKDSVLEFTAFNDGMFLYETLVPESSRNFLVDSFTFSVTIINEGEGIFLKYEKLKDLINQGYLFEVAQISLSGESKTIYLKQGNRNGW